MKKKIPGAQAALDAWIAIKDLHPLEADLLINYVNLLTERVEHLEALMDMRSKDHAKERERLQKEIADLNSQLLYVSS